MRRVNIWLALVAVLGVVWVGASQTSPQDHSKVKVRRTQGSPSRLEYPEGLSEESIEHLKDWLQRTAKIFQHPSRDMFRKGRRQAPTAPLPAVVVETEGVVNQPRLTGFVFEAKSSGRPLAAIRYQDEMWLVGVGDEVGHYRVERIVASEEVVLVDAVTGEDLLLTLK